MNRYIETYNEIVGFHYYPNAPEFCSYLGNMHRHVFIIRCRFKVSHNNREIEINKQQQDIENYLRNVYNYPCMFGAMSCEDIAQSIMNNFNAVSVTILEDNYGGATLTQ